MKKHSVVEVRNPGTHDLLTEVLRQGAVTLLTGAVEVELEEFLTRYEDLRDARGRQRLVRNGYLPEREIQTGIGAVSVRVPRVRDRRPCGETPIRFTSKLLPPYLRRSKSLDELLPWLYLKGVSRGDFSEALSALPVSHLGSRAPGLSASTISRLKEGWQAEFTAWRERDLAQRRYVYWWADGISCKVRMEDARQCLLVIIGVREDGRKELVALEDGYRESEQSWLELLLELKRRGLRQGPKLAVGDGAPDCLERGFWKALRKVYGATRQQRCWVHKTANVLNKLPKGVQQKAKQRLHAIWMAATKEEAERACDAFVATYEAKYPKAAVCLAKDRDALLAFYDFPAPHWQHLRTTNPIESTFATAPLLTAKTRGCLSRTTLLTMVFRLCQSAQQRWRRLRGYHNFAGHDLERVIENVQFVNGVRQERKAA